MLDSINIYENNCFKCLDISAYQSYFYQMHISGYVWKCLSLQGLKWFTWFTWKRLFFYFFHSPKKIHESYSCMPQIFAAYLCLSHIFAANICGIHVYDYPRVVSNRYSYSDSDFFWPENSLNLSECNTSVLHSERFRKFSGPNNLNMNMWIWR